MLPAEEGSEIPESKLLDSFKKIEKNVAPDPNKKYRASRGPGTMGFARGLPSPSH